MWKSSFSHVPLGGPWRGHEGNFRGEVTVTSSLKVPKRAIFDRSDFPDFYTIKSSWVGDLVVKILTYYFNF
jgi:hypothetical protein